VSITELKSNLSLANTPPSVDRVRPKCTLARGFQAFPDLFELQFTTIEVRVLPEREPLDGKCTLFLIFQQKSMPQDQVLDLQLPICFREIVQIVDMLDRCLQSAQTRLNPIIYLLPIVSTGLF